MSVSPDIPLISTYNDLYRNLIQSSDPNKRCDSIEWEGLPLITMIEEVLYRINCQNTHL